MAALRLQIPELQTDGCNHAWFEDRGPRCTLLLYVDDATSRLQELRFVESESALDYFASTRDLSRSARQARGHLQRRGEHLPRIGLADAADGRNPAIQPRSRGARHRHRVRQRSLRRRDVLLDAAREGDREAKGRQRRVLALQAGDRESSKSWAVVFEERIQRRLDPSVVHLGVMDGLPGLERAFRPTFGKAAMQTAATFSSHVQHTSGHRPAKARDPQQADRHQCSSVGLGDGSNRPFAW